MSSSIFAAPSHDDQADVKPGQRHQRRNPIDWQRSLSARLLSKVENASKASEKDRPWSSGQRSSQLSVPLDFAAQAVIALVQDPVRLNRP